MINVANSGIARPVSDAEHQLVFGLICPLRTIGHQCE
jgi:hypothetical protein